MEDLDAIRLQLTLHYDGSAFHGWQAQPNVRTVQGVLEETASRLTGGPRVVLGSGRTDSGVHATGQVAALDVPGRWSPVEFRRALNATLPRDVWVAHARRVSGRFHPRYDARARSYLYRVGVGPESSSPFRRPWCWALGAELSRSELERAARCLLGTRSFKAFSKAGQPERGEACTVRTATWSDWELGVEFNITADRYLHHMVRYLVGTMVDVARDRRPPDDVPELFQPGTRLETSPPAPPEGLYLTHVEYPDEVLDFDTTPRFEEGRAAPA